MSPSTLFLVATPIGNLEDITLRALRVLREVDLIAAEDTRHTAKLLAHYDIHTKTTSFYEQVEREKTPRLLEHLASGRSLALVSDAGTPGISDPGYRLTRAAIAAGFRVEAVPGASRGARGPGALRASDRCVFVRRVPAAEGQGARGVAARIWPAVARPWCSSRHRTAFAPRSRRCSRSWAIDRFRWAGN